MCGILCLVTIFSSMHLCELSLITGIYLLSYVFYWQESSQHVLVFYGRLKMCLANEQEFCFNPTNGTDTHVQWIGEETREVHGPCC